MSILGTVFGIGSGLYNIFKKGTESKDQIGDTFGVLGKYGDSLSSLLGLGSASPDYAAQAALQNKLNEQSVSRQLEANKELAGYEYMLNQQSINAQNRYNDPAEQMKRLKNAGLNPMLMYGQGATAGTVGNQSEVAKYNAPQAEKVDYISTKMLELQMMRQYQDVRLAQAQVEGQDLANEQAATANRIALNSEEEIVKSYEIQNLVANKEMTFKDGLIALNKLREDTESWNASYMQWKSTGQFYENSRNHEQAMYFRQMGNLIAAQVSNLYKRNELTDQQIKYIGKQIDLLGLDYRERKLLVEYLEKNFKRFNVPYNVWERLGDWGGDIVGGVAKAYLSRGMSFGQSSDPLVRTSMENYSPKTFY